MIISLNWLKQFTKIDRPVDELTELIGARLVEVEHVIDLGAKYRDVVIAEVKEVSKHPSADKLTVVRVDDGRAVKGVTRLENGLVEIVCAAPNVQVGLKVAWLPPGATVPSTYSKDPFVLDAKDFRGVMSNGMLASAKELAVGDNHDGIVEIDKEAAAGDSFADIYELDDYLFDIENKSLTHRPDCFGLIGFAREVAAINGQQFTTPDWLMALKPVLLPLSGEVEPIHIKVSIANHEIAARYQVVALDRVDATLSSPFAIQTWLVRVGIRPISAIVDITNYLMYLTGQPLHAFDLDKVLAEHPEHTPEIIVREAIAGEKLVLIDSRQITLASDDIVISAGNKPIALAGAMGGIDTEIDSNTKRVLLESATFDLFRLRTTSMRHGVFSEAVTRFTKGQSAHQTAPVLASAVRMVSSICGGRRISDIADTAPDLPSSPSIALQAENINNILGTDHPSEYIAGTLGLVECSVTKNRGILRVTPPYWRGDIHIQEDIAEEIGRIGGFDLITPRLPLRPFTATMASDFETMRSRIRQTLVRSGANEILTYNFVPKKLLDNTGESPDTSFRLVNSLSPELAYLRTSLLPSLLAKVHPNHKLGYDAFVLFEMNKTHSKVEIHSDGLPVERQLLGLVWSAENKVSKQYRGAAFFYAKKYVTCVSETLKADLRFVPMENSLPDWLSVQAGMYEPKRSAVVYAGDVALGLIGEMKGDVSRALKLPSLVAGAELDLELLDAARHTASTYKPLSRYPGTEKAICLRVNKAVTYGDIERVVRETVTASELDVSVNPVDIFVKKDDDKKQVTFTVSLTDRNKTITNEEANEVITHVAEVAKEKLGAEQV